MGELQGKVAVVTGSTSGIGREIALCLAATGCRIFLNGIDGPEIGDRVGEEMISAGAPAVAINHQDLLQTGAAEDLLADVDCQFGALDILINNAGVQHVAPIESFSDLAWDRIIELNLSAPFRLIKHALPRMRKNRWGRIINIASVHGIVASTRKSAYVAAKHGLVGLTKTVALETAADPVTCNAICPGYVHTALIETQIEAHAESEGLSLEAAIQSFLGKKQPSGGFVASADIGAMAAFLCSKAGDQVTGSVFTMDGGWTAQ